MNFRTIVSAAAIIASGPAAFAQAQPAAVKLDTFFAKAFSAETPGCAVGISEDGAVTKRAYGLADLERNVGNTAETIFESGSVAKQFTAMAILLLEQDGKLKTSDDIRKYLPEMPDYGKPVTIEMLLNHTSGLRDWGSVAAAGGLPRGERNFTNADVLDMVKRQKVLNYTPGAEYSYTNSGYNLAAIIVERVSGKSFQEFSAERMFKPLGMTHSHWRDDFNEVVKGRSMAYVKSGQGYVQSMPFMEVVGNGGLLTTIGDLLIWNDALTSEKLGAEVTKGMTKRGVLNDGKQIVYGRGLEVNTWKGFSEISHSGGTGGYTTWLARYPDQKLSVALLCNTPPSGMSPRQVAELFLPQPVAAAAPAARVAATGLADPAPYAGTFANTLTGTPMTTTVVNGELRATQVPPLVRVAEGRWEEAQGGFIVFSGVDSFVMQPPGAEPATYKRVQPAQTQLDQYAGAYSSDEAGASYVVEFESNELVLKIDRRPEATAKLRPIYKDAFSGPGGRLVRFKRNSAGKITAVTLADSRMRELTAARTN